MEGCPLSRQRTNWARSITSREERLLESVVCVWVYVHNFVHCMTV